MKFRIENDVIIATVKMMAFELGMFTRLVFIYLFLSLAIGGYCDGGGCYSAIVFFVTTIILSELNTAFDEGLFLTKRCELFTFGILALVENVVVTYEINTNMNDVVYISIVITALGLLLSNFMIVVELISNNVFDSTDPDSPQESETEFDMI